MYFAIYNSNNNNNNNKGLRIMPSNECQANNSNDNHTDNDQAKVISQMYRIIQCC